MDAKLRKRLEQAVLDGMASAGPTIAWGKDECGLWAVEPIRIVLGYDPAENFRGRYRTRRGAMRVLGKGGLAAALRSAARRYGWRKIEPAKAKPGDIGLVQIGTTYGLTVCRARGWFVGRSDQGFVALPAEAQRMAWSVG